eukprot:6460364-Amphidinium_carterae.1
MSSRQLTVMSVLCSAAALDVTQNLFELGPTVLVHPSLFVASTFSLGTLRRQMKFTGYAFPAWLRGLYTTCKTHMSYHFVHSFKKPPTS